MLTTSGELDITFQIPIRYSLLVKHLSSRYGKAKLFVAFECHDMDGHTSMQSRREWLTFREFRPIRLSPALTLQ